MRPRSLYPTRRGAPAAPTGGRPRPPVLTPTPTRRQLSGSQISLTGETEAGAVQVCGSLHFALRYEPDTAELRVQVIQCQGLAAARRHRSDP